MAIKELIILQGESLYDLTIRAYGDMRGYPDILRLNPDLDGVGVDLEFRKLNFNKTNRDHIEFPNNTDWIGTNDFTVTIKVENLEMVGDPFLIGYEGDIGNTQTWALFVNSSTSTIKFRVTDNHNLEMPFVSEGIIKLVALGFDYKLYLDDELKDSFTSTRLFEFDPVTKLLLGAYGYPIPQASLYLTGSIHWVEFINDGVVNRIRLNEGTGNQVVSDLGQIGTIKTSNAGGQSYIDSTMWEIGNIISFIGFQGDEIIYDDSLLFPGVTPESFLPERLALPDYLIVEGQSMYDLGVQLYGDMTEGMRQLLPYLENTDRGTLVKRTVPVSNIGEVFNDNNVVVATKPEFEEDTRISLEGGLEMPVVGTGGNIFDNTFSPPFN